MIECEKFLFYVMRLKEKFNQNKKKYLQLFIMYLFYFVFVLLILNCIEYLGFEFMCTRLGD
jgi:uncharacterized membrane protein YdbT with pleckstrin-like domain